MTVPICKIRQRIVKGMYVGGRGEQAERARAGGGGGGFKGGSKGGHFDKKCKYWPLICPMETI